MIENESDLRTQLEAAKRFKERLIAQAEREIEAAHRDLERAEGRLAYCKEMIPYDALSLMKEQNERAKEGEEERRLKDAHLIALREARTKRKGILPSIAFSTKHTVFQFGGLGFGCLASYLVIRYLGGFENELAGLASIVVGGIAGVFAGSWLFGLNFVEDESLDEPLFERDA